MLLSLPELLSFANYTVEPAETVYKNEAELRAILVEVAFGECEWPESAPHHGEQMAHLKAKGMGGSRTANKLSNVALLCIPHHHYLDEGTDGDKIKVGRRFRLRSWLEDAIRQKRRRDGWNV